MERDELSLKYINMRTGGITRHPANDGVYLKSIVKMKEDAMVLFPTKTGLTIFDGLEFYTEMMLNIYKKKHPDFWRQRENLRRLLLALGIGEAYTTRLIYGTDEVAIVDKDGIYLQDGSSVAPDNYSLFDEDIQFKADAIITDRKNVALLMYSADCPTAFLRDKRTGAIGVLHSMWRGLVIEHEDGEHSSIVKTTVEAMTLTYGTDPADLEVTIFPCADIDQYEVGEEVARRFRDHGLSGAIVYDDNGRAHLNLNYAMIELFLRSGVPLKSIELTPFTTSDYGLNSLRLAPTNCTLRPEGMSGSQLYDSIQTHVCETKLHSAQQIKDYTVRTSTLNFLIAMRA